MRALLFALLATTAIAVTAEAGVIEPGPGASVAATATGVYEIVITNGTRATYRTLALMDRGRIVEVHTRRGTNYLARTSGSPAVKVTSGKFNTLITIAGGVNRDVNKLPAATRDSFNQTAGLDGSGSSGGDSGPAPMEVAPANDTCPPGYELKLTFVAGRKQMVCRLATQVLPAIDRVESPLLARAWSGIRWAIEGLVAPAQARIDKIVVKLTVSGKSITTEFEENASYMATIRMTTPGGTITWQE